MNSINLIGRLTAKPELKYTTENKAILKFNVAINRPGKEEADFPRVTAFGKTAENMEKYLDKGSMIGVSGRIQTGSYKDKEGKTVYTTDIIADRVDFLSGASKKDSPEDFQAIDADIPF